MIRTLNISLKKTAILQPGGLIAVGYFLIAATVLTSYLSFTLSGLVLGVITLPIVLRSYGDRDRSYRYAWITLFPGILCFLMPVKTLLFFTVCFALIFVREIFYGKTGILVPVIVMLASPVFQYLASTFSFPLRIQLSAAAAFIFRLLGCDASAQGNVIIYQGREFSVDPACMGLNMITTSLLLGVALIAFYQFKLKRKTGNLPIVFYLLAIFIFNIVANLFRILMLVIFNIPPGSVSHDMAGITCLLIYVFFPAVMLASFIVKRSPELIEEKRPVMPQTSVSKNVLFNLLLLISISLLAWKVSFADTFEKFSLSSQRQIDGYTTTSPAPGILKLENKSTLIYLKYLRGCYDTDHNPMICWTGSGYQFDKVMTKKIGGNNIFTALLTNNSDTLYSAWWYDNGKIHTTSQFEWRFDLLQGGDNYILVNVTCSTKEKLDGEIEKILQQQTLASFLETN
jgi:exosortase N